jgi:hypothetical protein
MLLFANLCHFLTTCHALIFPGGALKSISLVHASEAKYGLFSSGTPASRTSICFSLGVLHRAALFKTRYSTDEFDAESASRKVRQEKALALGNWTVRGLFAPAGSVPKPTATPLFRAGTISGRSKRPPLLLQCGAVLMIRQSEGVYDEDEVVVDPYRLRKITTHEKLTVAVKV